MQTENLWLPYCQMKTMTEPFHVVGTDGNCILLKDGRKLIDGIASWWTACHGYRHPQIETAVIEQLRTLPHVMLGGLVHEPAMKLAERLARLVGSPNGKVFFSDSGSVAVEVAMKIAVQHWRNRGESERNRFICFRDSYHGDTVGAMSLCDPVDSMHSRFKGFLLEQYSQPIPACDDEVAEFDRFLASKSSQVAGVIVEPLVQMAAGMRFHSPSSLRQIFDRCQQAGLPLIVDEIATGFGRTGTMFAFEQADIQPDIICLGKALSGGTLPIAATVASENIYASFHADEFDKALMHGPTFMGNPLACAAANASLDLFETEPRLDQVNKIEDQLKRGLADLGQSPHVHSTRCLGAIGVVQLKKPVSLTQTLPFFVERGCWLRPLRDVIYLTPSFPIGDEELEQLILAIREFVAQGC